MRDKIKMVSSAGTGHYYTTDKNKRTTPDKLEMKKFDPVVRKHVIYKESKIKEKRPPEGGLLGTDFKTVPGRVWSDWLHRVHGQGLRELLQGADSALLGLAAPFLQ